MPSLDSLNQLRNKVAGLRIGFLRKFWKMDIDPTVSMSFSAKLDRNYPQGVHIGKETYLAFESRVLTHDMTRNINADVYIGERCFIGGRATILPGVRIGDGCIVAACAVVTKSVPPGSIVAGNPAVVIRDGLELMSYGRLPEASVATVMTDPRPYPDARKS